MAIVWAGTVGAFPETGLAGRLGNDVGQRAGEIVEGGEGTGAGWTGPDRWGVEGNRGGRLAGARVDAPVEHGVGAASATPTHAEGPGGRLAGASVDAPVEHGVVTARLLCEHPEGPAEPGVIAQRLVPGLALNAAALRIVMPVAPIAITRAAPCAARVLKPGAHPFDYP